MVCSVEGSVMQYNTTTLTLLSPGSSTVLGRLHGLPARETSDWQLRVQISNTTIISLQGGSGSQHRESPYLHWDYTSIHLHIYRAHFLSISLSLSLVKVAEMRIRVAITDLTNSHLPLSLSLSFSLLYIWSKSLVPVWVCVCNNYNNLTSLHTFNKIWYINVCYYKR